MCVPFRFIKIVLPFFVLAHGVERKKEDRKCRRPFNLVNVKHADEYFIR